MAVLDRPRDDAASVARAIIPACEPLPDPEDAQAFGRRFDRFGSARIVLLGEASHGSSEFYRARAAITRRLIAQHDFSIVAVEADWPDANRIDRYVRDLPAALHDEPAFARFPTWMWRNGEVHDFVEWLREYNAQQPAEKRAAFRGLDVYSLRASIAAVIAYLDREDPQAAELARRRYACLTPWQADPAWYGPALSRGQHDPCEDAVVAQLRDMLDRQIEATTKDGEDLFDAAQNARIVRAAEQYYRLMYRGGNDTWNLRDRHMFETLEHLIARAGPDAKVVVWAHNSHIGDASATAMGWGGQFNIGELCRNAYRVEARLIGFSTDRGTVAAADDWDAPMKIKQVRPSRPDSYERVLMETGSGRALVDLRQADARDTLAPPRLERAIGVIYRPETELQSHYFEAVLPEQFDAMVWFEETRAITPLPELTPHGVPETYPFGV